MMYPYNLLFLLCAVSYSTSETKVGLLISKKDRYNNATKRLTSYAAESSSFTLITAEYDGKKLQSMTEACCQLINSGVSVVISKADSSDTAIQSDIFSPLKIPHLAVSATDPYLWNLNREYLIRLSTSDYYQSQAIYDLIKHYRWPEVSLLATTDSYGLNGMIRLENLLLADSSVTIQDIIFFPTQICNVSRQLTKVKYSLVKVIVLNVAAEFGKCVLEMAHEMGLMGSDYVWILTAAIAAQPEYLAEHNGNFLSFYEGLLGMRPAQIHGEKYRQFKNSYVLKGGEVDDLTSYTIQSYDAVGLVEAALKETTSDLAHNTVCSAESAGWDTGKTVLDSIRKINYTGISGEISFTDRGGKVVAAYDVLNFVDDKFATVGVWTKASGLKMSKRRTVQFFEETTVVPTGIAKNLAGRHLLIGSVEEEPFMYYDTQVVAEEGNDCWSGMVNDMVKQMANELGFTYEYIRPADLKFGAQDETTGEWDGMIGDLLAGRTDMIAIDLSTNTARKTAIDFSIPFMQAGLKAVLKSESNTRNSFFFLTPFNGIVWGMIFLVNFIMVLLICCLSTFSPFGKYGAKLHAVKTCSCQQCEMNREEMALKQRSLRNSKKFDCLVEKVEEEDRSSDASLYNSLWLISTGLVAQTSETLPFCVSGRFLIIIWWAFMLLITAMYTANLTAALTINNIKISLNNVLDLLDQDKYKWGVIGSRNPEILLETNNDNRYTRLVDEGMTLEDLNEGIEKIRDLDYFVFIDEAPILEHYFRDDCDVFSLGEVFQTFDYAFGFPKNSPLKSLLDTYMLRYRENGFIDTLWQKWSAGKSSCSGSDIGTNVQLDLDTLSGVFLVLSLGIVISVMLLLAEFIYAATMDVKNTEGLTFMKALKRRIKFIKDDLPKKKKKHQETEVYENLHRDHRFEIRFNPNL